MSVANPTMIEMQNEKLQRNWVRKLGCKSQHKNVGRNLVAYHSTRNCVRNWLQITAHERKNLGHNFVAFFGMITAHDSTLVTSPVHQL